MTNISIIIPTKNEETAIAKVLCSVPQEPKIMRNSEVIIVDSSTDATPIIAAKLGARVIKERRPGKGRAMATGAQNAKGQILVFLDGDCSYAPSAIPKLIKALQRCDLVLGCRGVKQFKIDDPKWKAIYRAANYLWAIFFYPAGIKITEPLTGFRAIRKKDWKKLELKRSDFTIETEMNIKAIKAGFSIKEIAVPNLKRSGASKFLRDPKEWFKILQMLAAHTATEKIKTRLPKRYARLLNRTFPKLKILKKRRFRVSKI